MNGIEFYKKSSEANIHISRNFLFTSYELPAETMTFIQDHHLTYLEKPVNIRRLIQNVQYIIAKTCKLSTSGSCLSMPNITCDLIQHIRIVKGPVDWKA